MKYNDNEPNDGADHVSEAAPAWLGVDTANILKNDSSITQNEFFVMLLRMHSELMARFERQMEQNREDSNKRFEAMDKRFEDMQRYMDKRFEDVNRRFEDMNKRFEAMDKRFEAMQKSIDKRFEAMQKSIDKRFRFTQRLIMLGFAALGALITIYQFLNI